TESLKSPYKMIAADVNNDKDITAIDLVELRKLILGIYDKLPESTSWKFVPKSYVFIDAGNPWAYPTQEVLTEMKDQMVKDFVGIKIGDVNASAVPHSLMGTEVRSTETGLIFEVEDRLFRAGESVRVEFRSPNFAGVSGFQGTLSTKYKEGNGSQSTSPSGVGGKNGVQTLMFESISTEGQLALNDKNVGLRYANEGLLTMSWNTKTGIDIDSKSILFSMNFVAVQDGKLSEVLRIGSQRTKAESYEGIGELGNLSIRFTRDGKEIYGTNTLYQNYPNPFDQRTVIGINLAQSTQGMMKITDVNGRVVKTIDREWNKGYNEVWLDKREMKSTGILWYSFESKGFTASKRMVIVE
ncbi:MAG: T9SS type A sorting domain-containing protein, partial [Saprospiraceae bacterium]|nr:T9SS type A sorting domain-containing protein [Saprospiraceae bacterium]